MPAPFAPSLVAPALAAVSAEKTVLRMIAAESAIFVILDTVLFPSFVRRPLRCDMANQPGTVTGVTSVVLGWA
jgi:hypothetical protein